MQSTASIEIMSEKVAHETKSERRTLIFEDILSGVPLQDSIFKYILWGLTIILITLVATIPFTLIPVHNVILCPQYWYEFPLQTILIHCFACAFAILNCSYWMNINYIKKFRYILIMSFTDCTLIFLLFMTGYMIWTHVYNYNYPVPFIGFMVSYPVMVIIYAIIWFLFPSDWRKNYQFRKRLKFFLLSMAFNHAMTSQYSFIAKVLLASKEKKQWVFAIFLPLIREINNWIMKKLAIKSASGDTSAVSITTAFNINTRHALFLSYVLGSVSTTLSSYIILGMDFTFNVFMALRIVWWQKRKPGTKKVIVLLQELMVAELVEFMVPLIFLLVFLMSYYGPNSELIGNIKSSYWQYQEVEDVDHAIENISLFFFIDLVSGISCSLILWISCRINILRVYVALKKEFGLIFFTTFVYVLSMVSEKFF